jgi:hypothetical protein
VSIHTIAREDGHARPAAACFGCLAPLPAQVDDFRIYIRDAIKRLLGVTDEYLDTGLARVYVYDKYIPDSM